MCIARAKLKVIRPHNDLSPFKSYKPNLPFKPLTVLACFLNLEKVIKFNDKEAEATKV